MTIRATIKTETPMQTAMIFQGVLAADRGFTSELRREEGGSSFLVVASDGQAIRFQK